MFKGILVAFVAASVLFWGSNVLAKPFKKAEPAESTGFTAESFMRHDSKLPFHKAWKAEGVDLNRFTEIYIAPVNTRYLKENGWWEGLNVKDIDADIEEIAVFARAEITKAFQRDSNHRFKVDG